MAQKMQIPPGNSNIACHEKGKIFPPKWGSVLLLFGGPAACLIISTYRLAPSPLDCKEAHCCGGNRPTKEDHNGTEQGIFTVSSSASFIMKLPVILHLTLMANCCTLIFNTNFNNRIRVCTKPLVFSRNKIGRLPRSWGPRLF